MYVVASTPLSRGRQVQTKSVQNSGKFQVLIGLDSVNHVNRNCNEAKNYLKIFSLFYCG
jgi:hypothetical protein